MSVKRVIKPFTGAAFYVLSGYRAKGYPDAYIWNGLWFFNTAAYDAAMRDLRGHGMHDGVHFETWIEGEN